MATMSSMRMNKAPFLEQTDINANPNYTYNNYKLQNSMQMMQGNGTITSQEKYYSNLYTINQNPMFFSFKERSGKLRWKDIMKLDIESMIKSNDISALEAHLENLIFSNVDESDVEIITENTTVKLIKIYQHILEYLLHTQIRLENENKMLETNYSQLLNESILKENTLKDNKNLISTLKKDKKEKETILNTYKCIIEEYKNGGFANTVNFNTQKRNKMSASLNPHSATNDKSQYFFCQYCSGKKFSSEENLNNHYQRRHANQRKYETLERKEKDLDISDLRQSKRDYVKNLESQVEELKNLFQNFMKNNFQNESLSKLAESQKMLENKLGEVKNDKEKMVNLMEENFKKTLVEIKEFVKTNAANNSSSKFEDHHSNNESLIKQKEGIDTIKNNITQMNVMISEVKKNQNEKIQNIYEQLNNIKSTISSEIRDLKTTNQLSNSNYKTGFNNNQSFNDNAYNNFRVESVELTNAFSISNLPENLNKHKRENVNNIKAVKPYFNAGPLESDYSEDEKPKNIDLRKNESVKISQENRNNLYAKDNKDLKEFTKQNNNLSVLEQQRLEKDKSEIQEIRTENSRMPKEKNDVLNKMNLKEEQIEKNKNEMDVLSQDKVVDISNITREQKKIMKMDESKLKNKSEHEIVMDDISENVYKNIKNINEKNKDEDKNNVNDENSDKKGENNSDIQLKKKNSKIPEIKKNEIQIIDFKTNNLENYVLENENLDQIKSKFVTQYEERERLFKMANIDMNNVDLEKDDLDFYRKVLQKPNGEKRRKFVEECFESKVNYHMQSVTNNEDMNVKSIETKRPEELINLIDNILNFINTQKENANEIQETDNDESEDYNQLFGKYYYELSKTIFKKINLEEEYNFMINNINGVNRNSNVNSNFRETLSLPKINKEGNKFISKMEDKSNQLIESREVNDKIKNFNKDQDNKSGNLTQKFNIDDEFNH